MGGGWQANHRACESVIIKREVPYKKGEWRGLGIRIGGFGWIAQYPLISCQKVRCGP